jgi:peptidyl-prolyl cis-trans isomerase D
MINDALIQQYADDLGLRISDKQIRTQLLRMPEFQNDGKFDQEIYMAMLRRAGYSVDSFAAYLRQQLTQQQLLGALQGSDFSLQGEIDLQSQLLTQERDIRTATLNVAELAKGIELTDDELQGYYDSNPGNFTRPEQVKVAYVELSAQGLKEQLTVSDEEAQDYYQQNIELYSTAEQRQLSHILVQGDDKAKAQEILDELNSGADFATLAAEKSEDIGSAEANGSLGWVEKDVMDADFESAAFALENVGDVTGLVKSSFGYHIIKLDGLKASQAKPYSEVVAEIKADLIDQLAVERFYELQTELETVAFEYPDSLDDAASAIGQPIKTTDFISRVDAPALLSAAAIQQAILSPEVKEDGLNSEVLEVAPEHVIVVRVEDARDEMVLPFTEVKSQIETELSQVKAQQQAEEIATAVLDGLNNGDTGVVAANGLAFTEVQSVTRQSPFAQTVFAMPKPAEGSFSYQQTSDIDGNLTIIELSKVAVKPDASYDTQIGTQLVRNSSQQDLNAVINTLRQDAEIEYYVLSN